MYDINLALDWNPNTNHPGFYVAQSEGNYEDHDLAVSINQPA